MGGARAPEPRILAHRLHITRSPPNPTSKIDVCRLLVGGVRVLETWVLIGECRGNRGVNFSCGWCWCLGAICFDWKAQRKLSFDVLWVLPGLPQSLILVGRYKKTISDASPRGIFGPLIYFFAWPRWTELEFSILICSGQEPRKMDGDFCRFLICIHVEKKSYA